VMIAWIITVAIASILFTRERLSTINGRESSEPTALLRAT